MREVCEHRNAELYHTMDDFSSSSLVPQLKSASILLKGTFNLYSDISRKIT